MSRGLRKTPGGYIYHAHNRAVTGLTLFKKSADYQAFLGVVDETLAIRPIRILGYCVLPDQWHFILQPKKEGEVSGFIRWLAQTHGMRWHSERKSGGAGHLYRGRFKSFPVEADEHLLKLLRYIESYPVRAGLVDRAEDWQWSSLHHRAMKVEPLERLSPSPVAIPSGWVAKVNRACTKAEQEALENAVKRGQPYGTEGWVQKTAKKLLLESSLRPRGRPRKNPLPKA